MPPARLAFMLLAVMVLAGATILLIVALPADLRAWLVPILMIAAISVRTLGRRNGNRR